MIFDWGGTLTPWHSVSPQDAWITAVPDAEVAARRTIARARPGSPVRGYRRSDDTVDLVQAPVVRSVLYMSIGLIVMIWGIASLVSR